MVGQLVGNYRVVRDLTEQTGRGGSLQVFAVSHEHTKHQAVLKLLPPNGAAEDYLRAARALYLVRDPGLCEILDVDQLPDGTPYIIHEHIEGEPLDKRLLRFGRVPELAALLLCQQMASALQAAHRKGVAPLGLSAQRVVIIADPAVHGEERAKILLPPPALLAPAGPGTGEAGARDETGTLLDHAASPPPGWLYLAPEERQHRGPGAAADAKADVFALGVLLYEMLTGWHPFAGLSPEELAGDPPDLPRAPAPLRKVDPGLRAEVEALVGRMLGPTPGERPSIGEVAAELGRLSQRPTQEIKPIFDTFGKYRVVRQLGEGGMGTVFEGVNDETGHQAAIKVLHQEMAQLPQIMTRFYNEARTANRIRHPGVVSVFELGQLPDRPPYIVMEYLEGESLQARQARSGGALGRAEALHLIGQVAEVMAAAHDKGVIHRDLKPDNVMIIRDPFVVRHERVKVLDFGIAKVAALVDRPGDRRFKTKTGAVLGTPLYMAPEQCRGTTQVTDKADVYSLGVMLYQLLTGRTPFEAEGVSEVMAMHLYCEPRPLAEADPSLSRDLGSLVQAMLSKDPAERPPMKQVAAELRWLESEPLRGGAMDTLIKDLKVSGGPERPRPPEGPRAPAPGHATVRMLPPAPAPERRQGPSWLAQSFGPEARFWLALSGGLVAVILLVVVSISRVSGEQAVVLPTDAPVVSYGSLAAAPPVTTKPGPLGREGPAAADRRAPAARWSVESQGGERVLYGIWGAPGSGADDIFAVGEAGAVLHFDGKSWSPMSSGARRDLYSVWGSGRRDVYAVGEEGTLLRLTGGRWRRQQTGVTEPLSSVWGSRRDDVFVVGNNVILHYDGSEWQKTMAHGRILYSVWGSSEGDVYAVGSGGAVLHYDGRRWSPQRVPGAEDRDLLCVSGSGKGDVWAVGKQGAVLHFDGSSWSKVQGEGQRDLTLYGLWVGAPGEVWAVGEAGGAVTVLRGGGASFTREAVGPAQKNELYGIWGPGEAEDLFVVGKGGTILRRHRE